MEHGPALEPNVTGYGRSGTERQVAMGRTLLVATCVLFDVVLLGACGSSDPSSSDPVSGDAGPVATTPASEPATVDASTVTSSGPAASTAASSSSSTSTTTSTTSSTSTIPPTTIDPLEPTREAYSASDKAHDAALLAAAESYTDEGFGGVLWENVPTLCVEQAAIDSQWAGEVAALAWPADLQVYADELVAALTIRADLYVQCSQLGGSFFDQSPIFDQQDAAFRAVDDARKAVRRHLGLGLGE